MMKNVLSSKSMKIVLSGKKDEKRVIGHIKTMTTEFVIIAVVLGGFYLTPTDSATHWMVTEDGLSIQAATDSLYNMAQPHDLVQFLRQDDRLRKLTAVESVMSGQKSAIKRRESSDDPHLEEKMMENDSDCKTAGVPLGKQDLFASYVLVPEQFGFDRVAVLGRPRASPSTTRYKPDCTSFKLPFSMAAFEHLQSLHIRETLSMLPEVIINRPNVIGDWNSLADFGHFVALSLKENPKSWVLYNLATLYWRAEGKAWEAIECARRALHLTPLGANAMALLNLGNVLHRAGQSSDATVVLRVLLSQNDSVAEAHCALADTLVLTTNYSLATKHYTQCHRLDDTFQTALKKRAAVKCHKKLETALEMQHDNLQRTITELKSYEKRLEDVRNMHESVMKTATDVASKEQSSFIYDYFTYGEIDHLSCNMLEKNGKQFTHCHVDDWDAYKRALDAKHKNLFGMKRPSTTSHQLNPRSPVLDETECATGEERVDEAAFFTALEPFRHMNYDEPSFQPKYPLQDRSDLTAEDILFYDLNWPNRSDCEKNPLPLTNISSFPHIFVSPENKGYVVIDLLTKYLNLELSDEHPLPWYPPFCSSQAKTVHVPSVDHLQGVQTAGKKEKHTPETELKDELMRLAGQPIGQAEADVGQRINSLNKYSIGPSWMRRNLGALYWRVVGNGAEAVACLRLALSEDPHSYPDLALIQLAQLVITAANARLDDAITLLNLALQADSQEPSGHYLLGLIRICKNNMTGAHMHLKTALEIDPRFPGAKHTMRALRCAMQEKAAKITDSKLSKDENECYIDGTNHLDQNRDCKKPSRVTEMFLPLAESAAKDKHSPSNKQSVITDRNFKVVVPTPNSAASKRTYTLDAENVKSSETATPPSMVFLDDEESDEIPLDFGMGETSAMQQQPQQKPPPSNTEVKYETPPGHSLHSMTSEWQHLQQHLATPAHYMAPLVEPEKMTDRKEMLQLDVDLPEVLPVPDVQLVQKGLQLLNNAPSPAADECAKLKKKVNLDQATSTWLSVTAKGVSLESYIDFNAPVPGMADLEPICPDLENTSMQTMEHLNGYHFRDRLYFYRPEKGLKDAFQSLGNDKERIEQVAARLAIAMRVSKLQEFMSKGQDGGVHWTLSTMAALYWRVKGDASHAIKCLRHSLNNAPEDMRDLALVSLANVYHQAGMLHSALICGGAALQLSPKFVVVHFTVANIYATMGDYKRALQFYSSTAALQTNFEPAKERIRAIFCLDRTSSQKSP